MSSPLDAEDVSEIRFQFIRSGDHEYVSYPGYQQMWKTPSRLYSLVPATSSIKVDDISSGSIPSLFQQVNSFDMQQLDSLVENKLISVSLFSESNNIGRVVVEYHSDPSVAKVEAYYDSGSLKIRQISYTFTAEYCDASGLQANRPGLVINYHVMREATASEKKNAEQLPAYRNKEGYWKPSKAYQNYQVIVSQNAQ